ncbi:translation initiation factor IF-2 [Equus asinus]|uniref:translation initiation factor IF-2 n=1 Tax=Equus asinus TaxID=9793 RepID=UPI0038F6A855
MSMRLKLEISKSDCTQFTQVVSAGVNLVDGEEPRARSTCRRSQYGSDRCRRLTLTHREGDLTQPGKIWEDFSEDIMLQLCPNSSEDRAGRLGLELEGRHKFCGLQETTPNTLPYNQTLPKHRVYKEPEPSDRADTPEKSTSASFPRSDVRFRCVAAAAAAGSGDGGSARGPQTPPAGSPTPLLPRPGSAGRPPGPLTCQAQLDGPVPPAPGVRHVPGGGGGGGAAAAARGPGPAGSGRGGGDGEARRSHHSGRGWGPRSRRGGRHGRRVPDVPSVVAMSRGGSGTPSSPLLPLLLPRPGPHNKAAAAAGRAASARARAASTQPPPPCPPLGSARPRSRRGWSAEAGGARRRRSRTRGSAASSSTRPLVSANRVLGPPPPPPPLVGPGGRGGDGRRVRRDGAGQRAGPGRARAGCLGARGREAWAPPGLRVGRVGARCRRGSHAELEEGAGKGTKWRHGALWRQGELSVQPT